MNTYTDVLPVINTNVHIPKPMRINIYKAVETFSINHLKMTPLTS